MQLMKKLWNLIQKAALKRKSLPGMIYNSLAVRFLSTREAHSLKQKIMQEHLNHSKLRLKITESDKYVGAIDTGMYYNAGLAAVNSGKYNEAIKYFEKCAEMKYLGITPYFQMS